jgi:hypothetical protein
MIEILAQLQAPDLTAIGIQLSVGGIAVFMLRWFMNENNALMKAIAESHNRMGRKIAASNDRMGRAHLMLVLALDGVNEAAKVRARALVEEIDESLKQHEQEEQKEREGGQ